MLRTLFISILGLSLALNFYLLQERRDELPLDESHSALVRANRKIAHLENEIEILLRQEPALKAEAEQRLADYADQDTFLDSDAQASDMEDSVIDGPEREMRVDLKLGAISRVVNITDQEHQALRDLLLNNSENSSEEGLLAQVLGDQRAELYQQSREQAFSRGRQEELEKEAIYLSRKLELGPVEEESLRSVLSTIDEEVSEWRKARSQQLKEQSGAAPGVKMQVLIEEIIVRRDLMKSRLATLLEPEKFQQFLKLEAESSAADMETFHAVPESAP